MSWLNLALSCFEHWPSSFILILKPMWFYDGARLLSDVAGDLIFLSDNPLNFHAEIWSVLQVLLKNL